MNANTVDVVWRWAIWNATNSSSYHINSQLERDGLSPTCVVTGAVGAPNGNQRLVPTMTQDRSNFYAVHVFLSHSKYWHDTGNPLDLRGTHVEHAQINLQNGGLASVFEELSPATAVPGCLRPPCTCTSVHSDDECFVEQFAPSAANNLGAGTMAAAWHDTRLTPHTWGDPVTQTSGGFGTSAPPINPYPPILQDAPHGRHSNTLGFFGSWFIDEQLASGVNVPFLPLGLFGHTPWDDYEGMAVDTFTHFLYPVWGDSRNLTVADCPTSITQTCKSLVVTTQ